MLRTGCTAALGLLLAAQWRACSRAARCAPHALARRCVARACAPRRGHTCLRGEARVSAMGDRAALACAQPRALSADYSAVERTALVGARAGFAAHSPRASSRVCAPRRLSPSCRRAAARVDANIRNYGAYTNCQQNPSSCTALCAANARAAPLGMARLHRALRPAPHPEWERPPAHPSRRRTLISSAIPGDLPTELGRLTALTELCAPQRPSCPAAAVSARAPADRTTTAQLLNPTTPRANPSALRDNPNALQAASGQQVHRRHTDGARTADGAHELVRAAASRPPCCGRYGPRVNDLGLDTTAHLPDMCRRFLHVNLLTGTLPTEIGMLTNSDNT